MSALMGGRTINIPISPKIQGVLIWQAMHASGASYRGNVIQSEVNGNVKWSKWPPATPQISYREWKDILTPWKEK